MSRSGRHVALRRRGGLDLVDALGTAPRHSLDGDAIDFTFVGAMLWRLGADRIDRWSLDGRPLPPAIPLATPAWRLDPMGGHDAHAALVVADTPLLVHGLYDRVGVDEVARAAGTSGTFALLGRKIACTAGSTLAVVELGRGEVTRMTVPDASEILDVSSLFGGRALTVLAATDAGHAFVVLSATGGVIHRVAMSSPGRWAVAEGRGIALVYGGGGLLAIDLRYGRTLGETAAPMPVADVAIDADGQYVALAGHENDIGVPAVVHLAYTELFAAATRPRARDDHAIDEDRREQVDPNGEEPAPEPALPAIGHVLTVPTLAVVADAAATTDEPRPEPPPAAVPVVVPDLPPRALGEPIKRLSISATPGAEPYTSSIEHLDELFDLIAAQVGNAIADAWNSGQISVPAEDDKPFEREVSALLGHGGGLAVGQVADAIRRHRDATQRVSERARASLAAGIRLPLVELAHEFGLSSMATQILLVAMGPSVRGELARLYGILSNDEHRPTIDRFLLETIVGGRDARARAEVATELRHDGPLVRYGLVRVEGESLFAALSVDQVLIDRVRDRLGPPPAGSPTILRSTDRTLEQLRVPGELKRDLVLALSEPRTTSNPLRLVLRGRRGSGRTTLIAAQAACVHREVAAIDCERMPRAGKQVATTLRLELLRALLRRAVPVVSGLEAVEPADSEGQDLIKQVVRAHPGPVVIRATPESALPIEPGFVSFTLPPLSESQRGDFWRDALSAARLEVADVDSLAARFRIGPGIIQHVIHQVVAHRGHADGVLAGHRPPSAADAASAGEVERDDSDAGAALLEAARQHVAMRLGHIATHVTRLSRWEQVALPDDMIDSIRELIGRIRHRRTVYERWGFDARMTTSRGLTALFYGPPGTGKSMVAGLIARELGLDLYRIDLARVVSKWIGETEKNLAEVFDAAEDGQVVILFDEADSLFAKRTEVKTSVDRYANLEVNYLLQRLDSFEGIAILTTNLEGSIDPAFKRRMSLRLHFPFPDEDMRVRLWAAHVPAETPTLGDFDFVDLARRFPLSGGYIRNSALRAAFLAAQEERPLCQEHLVRAIQLEYRELGKLSTSGRIE